MTTPLIRNTTTLAFVAAATLFAPAPGAQAADAVRLAARSDAATPANCIQVKSVAEREQTVTDANGRTRVERVPAARVVPGDQVIWTVTATNVCERAAEKVVFSNPIPQHMSYVDASAGGVGSQIEFSLDGARFAQQSALTVRNEDGSERSARADEIKHIRWAFSNAVAPGQIAVAHFRASLK